MRCPNCAAENPDYAFYCGRCAAEIRRDSALNADSRSPFKTQPTESIEGILSRNILRMDDNLLKMRVGIGGRFRAALWKTGTLLVFKSDREVVTLSINKEGHASVARGCPSGSHVVLHGPHDSFLAMFQDEHDVGIIPGSIDVHLGNQALPDKVSERILKKEIWNLLHTLLE